MLAVPYISIFVLTFSLPAPQQWLIVVPAQSNYIEQVKSELAQYSSSLVEVLQDSQMTSNNFLDEMQPKVIINFSRNLLFYHQAVQYALQSQALHLSIIIQPKALIKNTYYIGDDYPKQCEYLKNLLSQIGWQFYHLIETSSIIQKEYVNCLTPPQNIELAGFTTLENMQRIVGRIIKPTGKYLIVSNLEQQEQQYLEQSMVSNKLQKKGSGLISIGIKGGRLPGMLLVMDETMMDVYTEADYIVQNFKNSYDEIQSTLNLKVWPLVLQKYENQGYFKQQQIMIKNVLNEGYQKLVISDILQLKAVYFQGDTSIPSITPPIITITMNSSSFNPTIPADQRNWEMFQGSYLAVEQTNQSDVLLPNFTIKINEIACSSSENNFEYTMQCIAQEELGQGLIGPIGFEPALNILQSLIILGNQIPYSAPLLLNDPFTNRQNFPNYFTTLPSFGTYFLYVNRFYRYLGWDRFSMVYLNGYDPFFDIYKNSVDESGSTICNRQDLFKLSQDYQNDIFDQNAEQLNSLVNSECRILILVGDTYTFYQILEFLYQKNYYLERYMLISINGFNPEIIMNYPGVAEWLPVALQGQGTGANANWYGKVGQQIFDDLKKRTIGFVDPGQCTYYDTQMVFSHTFDYMILRGLDYEDSKQTENSIRQIKFAGCTGTIMISSTRNDRTSAIYSFTQIYFDDQKQVQTYQPIIYDPDSSILIQYPYQPIWPLQTYDIPLPIIEDEIECGIPADEIMASESGLLAYRLVLGYALLIGFVNLFVIYKFFQNDAPQFVNQAGMLTSQDITVLSLVLIDSLFFIGYGPSWQQILPDFYEVQKLLKHDYTSTRIIENGGYFDTVFPFFIVIGVWLILVIFKIISLLKSNFVLYFIERVSELLLPIIGTSPFMVILQTIITIFRCEEGEGEDLDDSFNFYDCYMGCWSGQHLYLVIFGAISILLYCVASPFIFLIWQLEETPVLKINYTSQFVGIRQLTQIAYICVWGWFDNRNEAVMGIIQAIILILFLVFIIKHRICNYAALQFAFVALLSFVIIQIILVTIHVWLNDNSKVFLYLAISVVPITMLIGIILKKVMKIQFLLVVGSKNNITQLFRFILVDSEFPMDESDRVSQFSNESLSGERYRLRSDNSLQ